MKEYCCESDMIPEDYLKLRRYIVGFPAKMKNIFFRDHFASFLHFVSSQKTRKCSFEQLIGAAIKLWFSQNFRISLKYVRKIFLAKFCFISASFIFPKKCKISRKSLRNAAKNFRIFSRNFSFAGNPSP